MFVNEPTQAEWSLKTICFWLTAYLYVYVVVVELNIIIIQ